MSLETSQVYIFNGNEDQICEDVILLWLFEPYDHVLLLISEVHWDSFPHQKVPNIRCILI